MRGITSTAPILAIVLVAMAVSGCQSVGTDDIATQVFNARKVYVASVSAMTDFAEAGLIDLELAEKFEKARIYANLAISAAESALETGGEIDITSVHGALDALRAFLLAAKDGG